MKKIAWLCVIVGLLAVTAMPTLAAGGPPPGGKSSKGARAPFALAGTITEISGTGVTVQVVSGNRLVKDYIGQSLPLQTTSKTRYLLKTPSGTVPITFADLEVGQDISVNGTLADNVWTANRITVGASLVHQP